MLGAPWVGGPSLPPVAPPCPGAQRQLQGASSTSSSSSGFSSRLLLLLVVLFLFQAAGWRKSQIWSLLKASRLMGENCDFIKSCYCCINLIILRRAGRCQLVDQESTVGLAVVPVPPMASAAYRRLQGVPYIRPPGVPWSPGAPTSWGSPDRTLAQHVTSALHCTATASSDNHVTLK